MSQNVKSFGFTPHPPRSKFGKNKNLIKKTSGRVDDDDNNGEMLISDRYIILWIGKTWRRAHTHTLENDAYEYRIIGRKTEAKRQFRADELFGERGAKVYNF